MAARTLHLIDSDGPTLDRGPVTGGRMKIAFTTNDLKNVNAHFAGAKMLSIWEISADDAAFVTAVQFDQASEEGGKHDDDGESRIRARVAALEGCALLFVKAIGGPAAAKVVNANIHPVKLSDEEPIADVIARVQGMMSSTPPPWLRKVMLASTGAAGNDLAFLDDDD